MFYTLFCSEADPARQWQADLLAHSWNAAGLEGVLVNLVPDTQIHTPYLIPRMMRYGMASPPPVDHSAAPTISLPHALAQWCFRDAPKGNVLVVAPDSVMLNPTRMRVAPGHPAGRRRGQPTGGIQSAASPILNSIDSDIDFLGLPVLIHTDDLRMIVARWCELAGMITGGVLRTGGTALDAWMIAYSVAAAEYGLQHDLSTSEVDISTGVATDDAPTVASYTRTSGTISSMDGQEIFSAEQFNPACPLISEFVGGTPLQHQFLMRLDDFVTAYRAWQGRPGRDARPRKHDQVKEARLGDDLLLDRADIEGHLWINETGGRIWQHCEGARTIDEICDVLSHDHPQQRAAIKRDVFSMVDDLFLHGFLEAA